MSAVFGEVLTLGQGDGGDVKLKIFRRRVLCPI